MTMYDAGETTRILMDRFRNPRRKAESAAVDGDPSAAETADTTDTTDIASDAVTLTESRLSAAVANERCGDSVQLFVRFSDSGDMAELRHNSIGCSLCQVSADIMCEVVEGLQLSEAAELAGQVRAWFSDADSSRAADKSRAADESRAADGTPDPPPAAGLELFSQLRGTRTRARCVLLAWEALERLVTETPTA